MQLDIRSPGGFAMPRISALSILLGYKLVF